MKSWKLVLAIAAGVILGGGAVFVWFMFQLATAFLN